MLRLGELMLQQQQICRMRVSVNQSDPGCSLIGIRLKLLVIEFTGLWISDRV